MLGWSLARAARSGRLAPRLRALAQTDTLNRGMNFEKARASAGPEYGCARSKRRGGVDFSSDGGLIFYNYGRSPAYGRWLAAGTQGLLGHGLGHGKWLSGRCRAGMPGLTSRKQELY